MREEDRIKIFNKLNIEIDKDISFDFFNLLSDYKRRMGMKGSYASTVGADFIRVKSMIRGRFENGLCSKDNSKDNYVTLNDISKMSLKERFAYKQNLMTANTQFTIYEDIKNYIKKEFNEKMEVKSLFKKDNDNNTNIDMYLELDEVFDKVVIRDVNDIIVNNILNNNKLYIGVVFVRNERLDNLYDKFIDFNKHF